MFVELARRSVLGSSGTARDRFPPWRTQEGIVTVPGKGFGQAPGTSHFRITFLPQEEQIDDLIGRLKSFHRRFLEKYGGI